MFLRKQDIKISDIDSVTFAGNNLFSTHFVSEYTKFS